MGTLMRSSDRSLRDLNRSPLTRDQYRIGVGQMVVVGNAPVIRGNPTVIEDDRVARLIYAVRK